MKLITCQRYTHVLSMLLFFSIGLSTLPALSQTSDDSDWPDDVDTKNYDQAPAYFDMGKSTNPILKKYMQMEQADKAAENGKPVNQAPKKKKGLSPFKRKQKIVPLTNEQVTRVGPRETMPTRDPLLALPVGLELPTGGNLPSGFYLVKQEPVTNPTSDNRQLSFVRENRVLYSCTVYRTSSPVANADSPLSITNPKLPSALSPTMKVNITPKNENHPQTATLILQVGGDRFESEPFTISNDKRPPLRAD